MMISRKQIFKILIWTFFLILILSNPLIADGKKPLPPASPVIQNNCDQKDTETNSPDSAMVSPSPQQKEKKEPISPLIPPDLENTKGSDTKD